LAILQASRIRRDSKIHRVSPIHHALEICLALLLAKGLRSLSLRDSRMRSRSVTHSLQAKWAPLKLKRWESE
jgi:hypothetical protein